MDKGLHSVSMSSVLERGGTDTAARIFSISSYYSKYL